MFKRHALDVDATHESEHPPSCTLLILERWSSFDVQHVEEFGKISMKKCVMVYVTDKIKT